MAGRVLWGGMLLALVACAVANDVRAQGSDPSAAAYCEPPAQTKLLYTNRGYLILPKPADAPPFVYSYVILETQRHVERHGQLLFDDGEDRWAFESNPEGLAQFWPLKPRKRFEMERVNRYTRAHALVSFEVIGLETIEAAHRSYKSWKIRRLDHLEQNETFTQYLWYSPELCTLAAFTDSQNRTVTLLRVLKPGDRDYDRGVVRRNGKLYFTDNGELVK